MTGIIKSFNFSSYKDIAKQSFVRSFGFLFVFIAIISTVISFKYALFIKAELPQINAFLIKNLNYISSDFPVTEIKDGKLVLPEESYLKVWDKSFAFIIQPKTEDVYSILDKYPNALLISHDKLMLKTNEADSYRSRIQVYKLERIKQLKINPIPSGLEVNFETKTIVITPDSLGGILKKLFFFVWPALFLCLFFVYSFLKSIQVIFFSIVSLIFNTNLKTSLSYKQLLNIGIYALVPPVSLAVVKELLNVRLTFFGFLYAGIYVFYLFQGINSTKEIAQGTSPK